MADPVSNLFDTTDFNPRWLCGNWSEFHGWVHIVADIAIAGAYATIPCGIAYFALKRREVPFIRLYWLFAVFIFSCGLGHLIEATLFWQPWYRLSGAVKVITAVASWLTAIVAMRLMPTALTLPGVSLVNARLRREIQSRRRTQERLREREHFLQRVTDVTPGLVYVLEVSEERPRYIFINPAGSALLGLSEAEVVGLKGEVFARHVHPEDLALVQQHLERCRHLPEGEMAECDFRLRAAGGSWRWLHSREAVFARGDDGRATQLVGAAVDVTERRQAEQAVASARDAAEAGNRAKDQFLAALSHELRTPLTPVLLIASERARESGLAPELRKDFALVRANVELQARLIDDLLDLARITHGKLKLRRETCALHRLVRETAEMVRSGAEAKQIELTFDLPEPGPAVDVDPARLQQVLWNVLKNAVKFTPVGGRISTRVRSDGAKVRLEIADTGRGLPEDRLDSIFEAFVQGDSGGTQFGGLGLGLSISRVLMQELGGSIRAESAGLGQGSTFVLELPQVEERSMAVASAPVPAAGAAPAEAEQILLIEDDETTRTALTRLLERRGHTVVAAGSLAEARGCSATHRFSLILSDLGLPDGDGRVLLGELRSQQPKAPAIALSGYGMEAEVKASLDAGFFAHLTKPVDMQQLEEAMRAARAG